MKHIGFILGVVLLNLSFCLSKLNAGPGALDPSFNPTFNGSVNAMGVQADGRIIVAGNFTTVNSSSKFRVARLFPDGSLDTNYLQDQVSGGGSGASGTVWALLIQPDGKVVIGGEFSSVNSSPRTRVARLNVNGSLDGTFTATNGPNNSVFSMALQTDGKIVIGGSFTTVAGTNRNYVARLNADGSVDTSFNTSTAVNGSVNAVAVQSDGKVLIGGTFTTVFGLSRGRIARLHSDGSIDQNFQSGLTGASGTVRCLVVQSDGKILIGGDFFNVNNVSRSRVAQLLPDGSLDSGFTPNRTSGFSGNVYGLAVQSNGDIVAVGDFTSVNSLSRNRIVRLYADGTPDPAFLDKLAGANALVRCVTSQSDGKFLIGGEFNNVNSTFRNRTARLYGDLYPPELVSQPASSSTNVGATVTFSANVNNPPPVNYQWRKDGVNIPGATLNSYTLFNVQTGDSGNYSLFLSNSAGGTTSSNAVLMVGIAPVITTQPSSLTVTQGQSAAFSVAATGTSLNYIWRRNATVLTGATNATYSVPSAAGSNAGIYTVIVSNSFGSVTSTGAVLTVFFPPTIATQPIGKTVGVNSNFTLNVTASGNPAITYQWRKNESLIQGATASSYTILSAQTNDAGNYDVIITNTFGSVTSSVASVNVGYAPVIVQQPQSLTNSVGGTAVFSGIVTGSAPLNLKWLFKGNLLAGETNAVLTLTNLQMGNIGVYVLSTTNIFGGAVSSIAVLSLDGQLSGGLVAYYPFNGNANDERGSGINGTVNGAMLNGDRYGASNSAYYFNGTNSTISFSSVPLSQVDNWTVAAWMKPASLAQESVAVQVGYDDASTGNGYGFGFAGNSNFSGIFSGVDWISSGFALPSTNRWYHLVMLREMGTTKFFVNGTQTSSNSTTTPLAPTDFTIGSQNGVRFFDGLIDDVRIYNRSLSTNEVSQLFSAEKPWPVIGEPRLSSGVFGFNLTALLGGEVVIEFSSGLETWFPIATNILDGNSVFFVDPQPPNIPARFYRIRP